MRFLTVVFIFVLGTAAWGQDRHDWQSLAQLQAGDRIRLSLKTEKTGPVTAAFQNWTPQQVTAGTVTARREDVFKIERYRQGGWGRGKTAAIGAVIGLGVGFGGGFAVGAATGGCRSGEFLCFSRSSSGAIVGGIGGAIGLVSGAAIGALFPRRPKELIYSAK
jgi:hypothetical protein